MVYTKERSAPVMALGDCYRRCKHHLSTRLFFLGKQVRLLSTRLWVRRLVGGRKEGRVVVARAKKKR